MHGGSATAEVLQALKNIQTCATDDDFVRAVGRVQSLELDAAAEEVLLIFSHGGGDGANQWPVVQLQAVTQSCLNLLEADLSVSTIAEVCTSGLALTSAFLAQNGTAPDSDRSWAFSALEKVSEDLNVVTVEIFRGIVRLEEEIEEAEDEDALTFSYWSALELSQTWRRLALWILSLLARLARPKRLQPEDLWEWAGHDALAIFVLVRALMTFNAGTATEGLPSDLRTLQESVLDAALSLQLPSVAFAGEEGLGCCSANEVSMADRHAALSRHRANLRECFSESGLLFCCLHFLAHEDNAVQCTVGLRFAAFIAAVAPHGMHLVAGSMREKLWQVLGASCDACCLHAERTGSSSFLSLRCHLEACVEIAHAVRPGPSELDGLLSRVLQLCQFMGAYDGGVMGAAAGLAACLGSPHECGKELREALVHGLRPEEASSVEGLLARRLAGVSEPLERVQLSAWKALLPEPSLGAEISEEPEASSTMAATGSSTAAGDSSVSAAESGGLRGLLAEAPLRFRCALDGKLLADPVRSPQGDVFERSTLQRWFAQNGDRCPRTGSALTLSDCPRAPDIRRELLAWVRSNPAAVAAARSANT